MLSKKYYEVFAQILGQESTKEGITARLTDYFTEDNPNFMSKRFQDRVKEWENLSK